MDTDRNSIFSDVEANLTASGVHMKDRDAVLKTIDAIAQDGPENLLFLSDFDMTLTRYWVNGEKEVVELSPLMPDNYQKQALKLAEKYHPIEVSKDLSLEEKIVHMVECGGFSRWEGNHELMIEARIERSLLREMVANANIQFRGKSEELFCELDSANIPLLIFSAGLGDTLLEVFKQFSEVRPNMHVVSNRLIFNEAGIAVGHTEPLVHSYNKGKSPEQLAAVEPFIVGRSNVILTGDSQGDPNMADSLPHTHHVLKIGFLNHDVEDLLKLYMDIYDIVLTGDCDMTVVNSIVKFVLHTRAKPNV